jgi:hypothetical protein
MNKRAVEALTSCGVEHWRWRPHHRSIHGAVHSLTRAGGFFRSFTFFSLFCSNDSVKKGQKFCSAAFFLAASTCCPVVACAETNLHH